MPFLTRREAVQLSATTVAAATVSAAPSVAQSEPSGWPQFQFDEGNTGYAPDRTGPVDGVDKGWEFSTYSEERIANAPAIADGLLVVASRDGNVYCLDAETGEEQWRLKGNVTFRSTPAISEGTAFAGANDGTLVAVDLASGQTQWSTQVDYDNNIRFCVAEGSLFGEDEGLSAFDPGSGSTHWKTDIGIGLGGVAVADGTVIAPESDTNRVTAVDAADGSTVWETRIEGRLPYQCSPVVAEGLVILATESGSVHALDAGSGDVVGSTELGDVDSQLSTPAVADGVIYYGTDQGTVHAISSDSGEILWQVDAPSGLRASPIVLGETVYFATYGGGTGWLYAVDAAEGTQRWKHEVPDDVVSLTSAGDWLYAMTDNGTLHAYAPGSSDGSDSTDGNSSGSSLERSTPSEEDADGTSDSLEQSTTSGGQADEPSGSPDGSDSGRSRQRGFFSNSADEPDYLSNPLNMTTLGFVLSVGGIIHQMIGGD